MNKTIKNNNLIYAFGAVCFPTTVFVYFCARNITELAAAGIVYASILIVLIISLIVYIILRLMMREPFMAMVFECSLWLAVYLEKPVSEIMPTDLRYAIRLRGLAVIFATVGILFGIAVVKLTKRIKNKREFVILMDFVVGIVLMLNLTSLIVSSLQKNGAEASSTPLIKTDFLTEDTDMPNVYWIHPDGMLGVNAVQKYYNYDQTEFLSFMEKRGFVFNETAEFEATHNTAVAIPVLTCPYAYDNYIKKYMETHEKAMDAERHVSFNQLMTDFRKHNEMINAFAEKGYDITVIGPIRYYYPPVGGDLYMGFGDEGQNYVTHVEPEVMDVLEGNDTIETLGNVSVYHKILFDFLNNAIYQKYVLNDVIGESSREFTQVTDRLFIGSDMSIANSYSTEALSEELQSRDEKKSHLTIVHDGTPHGPFHYNEDGSIHESSTDPLDYLPQHKWSETVVMTMVDMILEKDPEAVIVIQSDHGVHQNTEEEFKRAFRNDVDAIELWNSTMSAIRIPEAYKNGDEKYAEADPLNVSRYLTNVFVGKNYEYIK